MIADPCVIQGTFIVWEVMYYTYTVYSGFKEDVIDSTEHALHCVPQIHVLGLHDRWLEQ